ncbi:hypothetical protein J3A83DRAFT_4097243 [Scleroderma citrinum]
MQGDTFTYEPFTRISPRKKRKGKTNKEISSPLDLLRRAREDLSADGTWLSDCEEHLRFALWDMCIKPRRVLCLGLGSPTSSRDARAQLALLNRLCAFAEIGPTNISLCDPIFTGADEELFRLLGMRCTRAYWFWTDPIQDVDHSLHHPTIVFMPHCDLKLYEIVLRANWSRQRLCNMVLVANSFGDYFDHNLTSRLEREAPCLSRIGPLVESRPLPVSAAFPTAFNNLAVQYVKEASLSDDGLFGELPAFEYPNEREMC